MPDVPTLPLNRQGLVDRLDACFAMQGALPVTLLKFEVDGVPGDTPRRAPAALLQHAAAKALRARVRGGDLVACLDDGALIVGCVGAAPAVATLLLERLRAAVGSERGAGLSLSPGLALFCATRERCLLALQEIDRVHALGAAVEATAAALLQDVERRHGVSAGV